MNRHPGCRNRISTRSQPGQSTWAVNPGSQPGQPTRNANPERFLASLERHSQVASLERSTHNVVMSIRPNSLRAVLPAFAAMMVAGAVLAAPASAAADPVFSASPSPLAFGDQVVDVTSDPRTVTVTNIGDTELTISEASLGGPSVSQFQITAADCDAAVLAPSGTCSISLTFEPESLGLKDQVRLTFTSNDPASPHEVFLTGTGVEPEPTPTPTPEPTATNDWPQAIQDVCPDGNCAGADLSGAELADTDLRGVTLTGADLSGATIHRANVRLVPMRGADLRDATLTELDMSKADLRQTDLRGATIRRAELNKTLLRKADIRKALIRATELNKADLSKVTLRKSKIVKAELKTAKLRNANLSRSTVKEVSFKNANLAYANLRNAKLKEIVLTGANLKGVRR